MGKNKKKKRPVKRAAELGEHDTTPRSFIFHRGIVGKTMLSLIQDMRQVMQPYSATNLKVTKSNILKDFVHIAGPYGISHFMIFSKTDLAPYMKMCRLPRGPTLTFKVNEYSLMKDVVAILKRPKSTGSQFNHPCLAVLNNFGSEELHMKLMTTMFQNMFPSLKVQKVKLSEIRRCSVFNYDQNTGCVDFRHYNIDAKPTGVSRGVKKLLKNKIPNLGSLDDISDFMTGAAYLSESEGEEPAESQVILPQKVMGRGNMKAGQSAIKLTEIGPRLTLELLKIEDGVCDGEVLFHKYESRTEEEKKMLKKKKEQSKQLKEQRKRVQEKNVERKKQLKEENKQRSLAGMKRKAAEENDDVNDGGDGDDEDSDEDEDEDEDQQKNDRSDEDDDAKYYREEVGEEPDKELFNGTVKKKRKIYDPKTQPFSKRHSKQDRTEQSSKHEKSKPHGLIRSSRGQKNSKMSNVKFKPKKRTKR